MSLKESLQLFLYPYLSVLLLFSLVKYDNGLTAVWNKGNDTSVLVFVIISECIIC